MCCDMLSLDVAIGNRFADDEKDNGVDIWIGMGDLSV